MTDSMKCPYCNSELRTFMLEEPAVWYCQNRCAPMLPPKIWRDLITSKKAQDALKVATDCIESIGGTWRDGPTWTNDDMGEIRVNIEGYCDSILKKIKEIKK